MQAIRWMMVALALVAVACGGGDDVVLDDSGEGESSAILNPDFSTADLPGDFPDDLIAPEIIAGEVGILGEVETVSFETTLSYDEAVAFYTDALGEPTFEGGDAGGRLASWTNQGTWVVQVLDTSPVTIGVVRVPAE